MVNREANNKSPEEWEVLLSSVGLFVCLLASSLVKLTSVEDEPPEVLPPFPKYTVDEGFPCSFKSLYVHDEQFQVDITEVENDCLSLNVEQNPSTTESCKPQLFQCSNGLRIIVGAQSQHEKASIRLSLQTDETALSKDDVQLSRDFSQLIGGIRRQFRPSSAGVRFAIDNFPSSMSTLGPETVCTVEIDSKSLEPTLQYMSWLFHPTNSTLLKSAEGVELSTDRESEVSLLEKCRTTRHFESATLWSLRTDSNIALDVPNSTLFIDGPRRFEADRNCLEDGENVLRVNLHNLQPPRRNLYSLSTSEKRRLLAQTTRPDQMILSILANEDEGQLKNIIKKTFGRLPSVTVSPIKRKETQKREGRTAEEERTRLKGVGTLTTLPTRGPPKLHLRFGGPSLSVETVQAFKFIGHLLCDKSNNSLLASLKTEDLTTGVHSYQKSPCYWDHASTRMASTSVHVSFDLTEKGQTYAGVRRILKQFFVFIKRIELDGIDSLVHSRYKMKEKLNLLFTNCSSRSATLDCLAKLDRKLRFFGPMKVWTGNLLSNFDEDVIVKSLGYIRPANAFVYLFAKDYVLDEKAETLNGVRCSRDELPEDLCDMKDSFFYFRMPKENRYASDDLSLLTIPREEWGKSKQLKLTSNTVPSDAVDMLHIPVCGKPKVLLNCTFGLPSLGMDWRKELMLLLAFKAFQFVDLENWNEYKEACCNWRWKIFLHDTGGSAPVVSFTWYSPSYGTNVTPLKKMIREVVESSLNPSVYTRKAFMKGKNLTKNYLSSWRGRGKFELRWIQSNPNTPVGVSEVLENITYDEFQQFIKELRGDEDQVPSAFRQVVGTATAIGNISAEGANTVIDELLSALRVKEKWRGGKVPAELSELDPTGKPVHLSKFSRLRLHNVFSMMSNKQSCGGDVERLRLNLGYLSNRERTMLSLIIACIASHESIEASRSANIRFDNQDMDSNSLDILAPVGHLYELTCRRFDESKLTRASFEKARVKVMRYLTQFEQRFEHSCTEGDLVDVCYRHWEVTLRALRVYSHTVERFEDLESITYEEMLNFYTNKIGEKQMGYQSIGASSATSRSLGVFGRN